MTANIDFTAFFDATPSPCLVLDTNLVVRYVNPACLQATGRTKEELVGGYFFDVLPENPRIRYDDAEGTLRASLNRLRDTGKPETAVLQRYDVHRSDQPGGFEERWWSATSTTTTATSTPSSPPASTWPHP